MNGRRHAMLVGTSEYDELQSLRCAEEDVRAMQDALVDEAVGGFEDATPFVTGTTRDAVLSHAEKLLTETADEGDTVLLYFSGHGLTDAAGSLYLAVKDTRKNAVAQTGIPVEQLLRYLGDSRCEQALLIFDCCFSGNVRGNFRALAANSLAILASSGDEQLSYEGKEGERNSIFTSFLVDGLQTGNADLDRDGDILVDEAYRYTNNLVAATTLPQTPMYFAAAEGELLLGRNRNYHPIDLSKVPPNELQKFLAVKQMIELLREEPAPSFGVGITEYLIEGEPVRASMLTVSPTHTPNAVLTQTGMECDAFFEPHMLTPTMMEGKEVIDGRLVKVRMKLPLERVWMVVGKLEGGEGAQLNLYMGTPVFPPWEE